MDPEWLFVLRVAREPADLLYTAADRLRAEARRSLGRSLDVRHGLDLDTPAHAGDSGPQAEGRTILLAPHAQLPPDVAEAVQPPSDAADAYRIATLTRGGSSVTVVTGNSDRACLYGAYRLAEDWEIDGRVDVAEQAFEPVVPHRWLLFQYGVSGGWNASMRFDRTLASLAETPRYGINGVYMYNGPVWPWYTLRVEGERVRRDETEAAQLKSIFRRFKTYGLEIAYACPLDFPGGYTADQINAFLSGRRDLPGYLKIFQQYHRTLLDAFLREYPEVDALVASTVEGAMGWGFRREAAAGSTAAVAKTLFLDTKGHDLDVCAEVFDAYLQVFVDVLREHGKQGLFQTHSCGPTNKGLRKMREVLERYPDVAQIEDDRWNNSGWVNLEIYGFLPEDLKERFLARRRKGMKVICEGEFLGGGAMPTCIPRPLEDASEYTVRHGMDYHWARIDLHERTEYGTLFGINEINFLAATAPMWQPQRPLDELWGRWIARRFGREVVSELKPVLQAGWDILRQGTMAAGLPLLHGSRLTPKDWRLDGVNANWGVLMRFQKPGAPLVTCSDDEVDCGNHAAWQLQATSVPIARVREDQAEALRLNGECLQALQALRSKLSAEDHAYLVRIYTTTGVVIEALQAAVEGAYATQIMLDNYDNAPEPAALFDEALAGIERTADRIEKQCASPEVYLEYQHLAPALRTIAAQLQQIV